MGTPAEYPRRRVLCDLSEAEETAMNKQVTPEGKKKGRAKIWVIRINKEHVRRVNV